MKLIDRLTGQRAVEQRYTFEDWLTDQGVFTTYSYGGHSYTLPVNTTYGNVPTEQIGATFSAYVAGAYTANAVVWGCVLARLQVFSQARFAFQRLNYDTGEYDMPFGTAALGLLERPWPNGTTAELLARMEQDASLAGNCFLVRETQEVRNEDRITRLNPQWTQIVLSSAGYDAEVLGYVYQEPGGDETIFPADQVAHYSPIPDPLASYRGMSWLTPVVRNVQAHNAATTHKIKFYEHGASPNMVVSMPREVGRDEFERFVEKFRDQQQGVQNAYKTLFVGAGADVQVVGASLGQLDLKATSGADETLIAVAAGVPAVLLGISEGLAGSSLNSGNYGMARRNFADRTIRPLWDTAAATLAEIIDVPAGAELRPQLRNISFLREDEADEAEIRVRESTAIRQLVDAGFDADAVVDAVTTGDLSRLQGTHSGLFSVQLQPPGSEEPDEADSGEPGERTIMFDEDAEGRAVLKVVHQ